MFLQIALKYFSILAQGGGRGSASIYLHLHGFCCIQISSPQKINAPNYNNSGSTMQVILWILQNMMV